MKTSYKTTILASMIIGVIAIGYIVSANDSSAQIKPTTIPLSEVSNIKEQHPVATIAKGLSTDVLKDVPLKQLSQSSSGLRPDLSGVPNTPKEDNGVSIKMHYGQANQKDIVAVTVTNTNSKPISIDVLVISGYLHGDVEGSYVESLYRPIISDPTDVAGATKTTPEILAPNQSITTYVQDVLNADGFSTMACYSTDPQDISTHYCTSLPATWLR